MTIPTLFTSSRTHREPFARFHRRSYLLSPPRSNYFVFVKKHRLHRIFQRRMILFAANDLFRRFPRVPVVFVFTISTFAFSSSVIAVDTTITSPVPFSLGACFSPTRAWTCARLQILSLRYLFYTLVSHLFVPLRTPNRQL